MSEFIKNDENVLNNEQLENVSGGRQTGDEAMIEKAEQAKKELQKFLSRLDGMTHEQKEAYLKSIGREDLIKYL